jgi:hypothetical protein
VTFPFLLPCSHLRPCIPVSWRPKSWCTRGWHCLAKGPGAGSEGGGSWGAGRSRLSDSKYLKCL